MGPARSQGHRPRRQPPAGPTKGSEVEPSTGFARLHHPAQSDTARTRRPKEQGAGSWGVLGYQYNYISSLGVGLFVFFPQASNIFTSTKTMHQTAFPDSPSTALPFAAS